VKRRCDKHAELRVTGGERLSYVRNEKCERKGKLPGHGKTFQGGYLSIPRFAIERKKNPKRKGKSSNGFAKKRTGNKYKSAGEKRKEEV